MKFRSLIIATLLSAGLLLSGCSTSSSSVDVDQVIALSGEWFLNNQNDEFIHYEYFPFEKEHSSSSHAMREMGALWSIARLGDYLDDDRFDELARKGFGYFEGTFKRDTDDDYQFVNITPSKIKLGYNAFAILTLLEFDDYLQKEYYLKSLAAGIQFQQNEDGELRTFFYSDRDTGKDYYPGEALLAMMSLYEYDPDPSYLETVERAFPFYVDYWRSNENTAFVPWQTQAYTKLYHHTEDKAEVADFVFEMNDYMLEKHVQDDACSNFDFSRGIVTAVYAEGVVHAYELADEMGDTERVDCYGNFVKEGLAAVMELQFTEENNFGKPNHELPAVGGFLGNGTSNNMRVDRNQHASLALMKAVQLGLL
jgi:hypothetical protein